MQIIPQRLKTKHLEGAALMFIPKLATNKVAAIFTHGHTSHKGAILSWAEKLYHAGVPCLLFDLPGHYVGSASEVLSLETFKEEAPELFTEAKAALSKEQKIEHWVIGGHSLGALVSLMYVAQHPAENLHAIAVGLAANSESGTHLYQDPLFEKMLEFRSLLVSPALHHKEFFPWIRKEKENLKLFKQDLLLLSGKDDLVAKASDVESLAQFLINQDNLVEVKIVEKLPHHEPEKAATLIRDYIKTKFNL